MNSLRRPRTYAMLVLLLYSGAVVFALVLLFDRTAGHLAASNQGEGADVAARQVPSSETVALEIPEGTSADAIVGMLHESGIVRDPGTLRVLLALTETAPTLQAGRYELPRGLPPAEVLSRLQLGPDIIERITFRAGLRVEEIGMVLEREGIASQQEWLDALAAEPLPRHRALLDERPAAAGLNGYLLPATYEFDDETTALDLLHMMLDRFMEEVTADLVTEAEAQGLSLHELVTLAAVVEREAVHPEEAPLVASVFRNRLDLGMPLQADPTVQYAVAEDPAGGEQSVATYGYWKQGLTIWDLEIDSPYNTYLYPGLPPGPIANPGIDAIVATVQPASTGYVYFVAHPDCDGRHLFAETLEEHNLNVVAFRASPCGQVE